MENYKIIRKLGKGAQGAVYLVVDNRDGKESVLKKVECNDEGEATKAFKEAMALEQLTHKYICGYKEFFVNWDKAAETMYVCIVMQYYPTGDLDAVIHTQRSKGTALPEVVLKKWFGQMVEALVFVHGKKVIHRDLKPSNIFMTDNLDICLGDFGVATVMNDARTRTRTTVGTMNWMAPEVMERPYDERSDVWSLGCIVLDIASCGFADHAQSQSALFEIKHSTPRLEEVLQEVNKAYSKELCQVIRSMLRRKFQLRPTADDLLRLPYVRSCLDLSKSDLVQGDRQAQEMISNVKPTTTKRIPDLIPELFEFLSANLDRAGCQNMGLEHLIRLMAKYPNIAITDSDIKVILGGMARHETNHYVQISACVALTAIHAKDPHTTTLHEKDAIKQLLISMRCHISCVELQQATISLLWALATDIGCANLIGLEGGVHAILAVLRDDMDDVNTAAACCGALNTLCLCEANSVFLDEEEGLQDIAVAMRQHGSNSSLFLSCVTLLWGLSVQDHCVDIIYETGCLGMMAKAFMDFQNDVKIIRQICVTLSSLVVEEKCAFAIIENAEEIDGITALLEVFKIHFKDAELVECACALLLELADHEDVRALLIEKGTTEQLAKIKSSYAAHKGIVTHCENTLKLFVQNSSSKPRGRK